MSDESDNGLPMLVPKKKVKKPPNNPSADALDQESKKVSTKVMVHEAIADLTPNNRKGVSLHAIKKYMVEKYNVNTDKINFYIKKSIKLGVEKGTIVQTKGIGASGSFRLAPKKSKKEKKEKNVTKKKELDEISEQPQKKKMKIPEEDKTIGHKKQFKKKDDNPKPKTSKKLVIVEKKEKSKKKSEEKAVITEISKDVKDSKSKEPKKLKDSKKSKDSKMSTDSKISKEKSDPGKKKKAIVKRKSMGSIIKAPKMRPKAR